MSPREFLDFLVARLSEAIGPIADVIVEDGLSEMGETFESFKLPRSAELVNILSKDISRGDKKKEFQKKMMDKIRHFSH